VQDAGDAAKAMVATKAAEGVFMQIVDGRYRDDRWTADGRWDLSQFKDSKGEVDWDAVSPRSPRSPCSNAQAKPSRQQPTPLDPGSPRPPCR
jgi:hypothetical protein